MNKAGLVEIVQKSLRSTKAEAARSVDAVIDAIKIGLKRSNSVQVVGFGTFKINKRKARMGSNPQTHQPLKINASRTVKFLAGNELRKMIN